jgi:hypothetical protein
VEAVSTEAAPRRKRRIFLWFFLAVQLLFVVWLVAGAGAATSESDCAGLDRETCEAATAVGAGIGLFFIVMLWMIADFLLGVGYVIYRLAKRP